MFRIVAILVIAGACGALAARTGMPLPWLIGPLLATAAAALAGLNVTTPGLLRKLGQGTAAVAIGLQFSPSVSESLFGYLDVMVLASGASILASMSSARIMARLSRIRFETAYFASLPGGVAEMSVMAERYGGETALVALAQSLRIVMVVLTVPIAIVATAGEVDFSVYGGATAQPLHVPALLAMLALAAVIAATLDRLRIMNAWFLGGLAVGGGVALLEIPASGVPVELIDVAQVLIGCALGSRMDRRVVVRLRRFLPATILGTALLIAFNVALAWVLARWTGIDWSALVLATAPGGIAEMSITAKALHLAVAMVTAFHLVRLMMIIFLTAPIYRTVGWLRARAAAGKASDDS